MKGNEIENIKEKMERKWEQQPKEKGLMLLSCWTHNFARR